MAEPGPRIGDAFGAACLAQLETGESFYVVERDDGWVGVGDPAVYFLPPDAWPGDEIRLLDHVRGRVLDVGAGCGRHALELVARGHQVVALDSSPGAAECCRRRGLPDVFTGTVHEFADPAGFDTMLLAGHNLALLASPAEAPSFLARLAELARPGARIVGTNRDPEVADDPGHLRYHERNVARGRPAGQVTMRVRRLGVASPWFDYWLIPPAELEAVADPHGWRLTHVEPISDRGSYLAVLARA